MKIVSLNCPECGGKLDDIKIADGKKDLFCNFCGNHIFLENENYQVFEHRTIDEARIRELDLEAEKYRDQKQKRKFLVMFAGFLVLCGFIMFVLGSTFESFKLLLLVAMFPFIFAMICLVSAFDNDEKDSSEKKLK